MSFELPGSSEVVTPLDIVDGYREPEMDDYISVARENLELLAGAGALSTPAAQACFDYARTVAPTAAMHDEDTEKTAAWMRAVREAHAVSRGRAYLSMNLHPEFARAILSTHKSFEGRIALGNSTKDYPGMRTGDVISFSLQPELAYLTQVCMMAYGLFPSTRIQATVQEVIATPTVYAAYRQTGHEGQDFQPMIQGDDRLAVLLRIAQYYRIYPNRVPLGMFVGIRINNVSSWFTDHNGDMTYNSYHGHA